jgi:hypothetical protein
LRAQLYLYDNLRNSFQEPFRLYIDTFIHKILPVFSNIDEEARKVAKEHFKSLGRNFNPDYHDEGDFAEQAWEKGLDYYDGMSLMQYNTRLMWVSTLYQFWEQQVRKYLFEEINRTHEIGSFKDFCAKGIPQIKKVFLEFEQDLESLSSWEDINELRLLANVIKHGDGGSASQLQKLRPDFFKNEISDTNLLELYKNTLTNIVLNVKDEDYTRYCESLIEFWDELPERMYVK